MEDKTFTANDGPFNNYFWSCVSMSGYTLLVGSSVKDDGKVADYEFFLAGYGFWGEVTKLIPINGIFSRYYLGYILALYYDKELIRSDHSGEKGDDNGVAYIYRSMNGGMTLGIQYHRPPHYHHPFRHYNQT